MLELREHSFLGMTQSLCPDCLAVVPAKIIARGQRVYFRKTCPTHGAREDFVCSDVSWFDRAGYVSPGKLPRQFGTTVRHGCPYDCGLCSEHEQHTCIALLEITDNCNLTCPMCFASSAPGRSHVPADRCKSAIDRLVAVEGRPEVLQLSGGEPTIHPEFLSILDYACDQPIDVVMINTNGVRLAKDRRFLEAVAEYRSRAEVYLQFDGFHDSHHEQLRGKSLLETKLAAVEAVAEAGLKCTLVCTLQHGVNEDQVGEIIRFAAQRPQVTGVSFQPATYTGRYFLPRQLDRRVTVPDVIHAAAAQTGGVVAASDFLPLPCAHPNAHTLAYLYRDGSQLVPLNRFLDLAGNLDLLANGIVFTRERAKTLIGELFSRSCCGSGDCCGPNLESAEQRTVSPLQVVSGGETMESIDGTAAAFFAKAMAGQLRQSDLLRITITSFMDAYNFDLRQLMKSCVHHLLPSGHLIPFSAYNVLYREGHLPLPPLDVGTASEVGDEVSPVRPPKSLPVVIGDGR
jgi:hypothetical protein